MMLHLLSFRSTLPADFNMRIGITFKKVKQSIRQMLTLLLLVLYIAGATQFDLLHSFVHQHKRDAVITQTFGHKIDPCHLSIFDNDTEHRCHHDSHLHVSDTCDMCDLVLHGDKDLLANNIFSSPKFSQAYFDSYKEHLDSYWAVISSSRAPPALP